MGTPGASAGFGQLVTRVLDSVKRDKILKREHEIHLTTLERNVYAIERYRDVFILDDKDICSWYMDLQDAMYAAVDALDVYSTAVDKQITNSVKDWLQNILYTISIHQFDPHSSLSLARTVELINQRIAELLEEGRRHGYQDRIESELKEYPELRPKSTHKAYRDLPIIGRDKEKDEIRKWLKAGNTGESCMRLQILPIVGMGGIGKTTLAQCIYASEKHNFDLYGWVHCPPETTDAGLLLKTILSRFGMSISSENMDLEELTTSIEKVVQDKKFLLIMDDVWNKKQLRWEDLLNPLTGGKRGSKLIITTRDMDVVKKIEKCHRRGVAQEIKLEDMDEENLWKILKDHAYGVDETHIPSTVELIGKQIVKRVKGLPLAAKAVGCLMGPDQSPKQWENLLRSDLWKLLKSEHDATLVPALVLSFMYLPPQAKPCFTYCSLLDRDGSLTARQLVYQWLAHNYLQVEDIGSMEDAGAHMINHLERMSLLTTTNWWHIDDTFKQSIRMHDLIYETSRALGMHDHLQILDDGTFENQLKGERVRHLSICMLGNRALEKLRDCTKLRTLILTRRSTDCDSSSSIGPMLCELKSLRVLTLSDFGIQELPKEICELKHLRYLDLSGNCIARLPATIAELHHLQVLILSNTDSSWHSGKKQGQSPWYSSLENTALLGKLSRLRYLDLSWNRYMKNFPTAITLLSDLRLLSLSFCESLEELPEGISILERLECLELDGCPIRELPVRFVSLSCLQVLNIKSCFRMKTLPFDFNFLKNLNHLFLEVDMLHTISGIGKLSSLKNLEEFSVQHKEGHKIDELANLNMLCGKLTIRNLQAVKSEAEAKQSQLEEKIYLKELEFHWLNPDQRRNIDMNDQAIIEGLKPRADNLIGLTIKNYMGMWLPTWFKSKHLCHLKRLCLSDLLNLRFIGKLQRLGGILPFLEELEFFNLPQLYNWKEADNNFSFFFPRLKEMRILKCPKLPRIPAVPRSLKYMQLQDVGFLEIPKAYRYFQYSQVPLLASIQLRHCYSLLSLNNGVLIQDLPSLRQLIIERCGNLQHPPDNGFTHLESLETLELIDCPKLSRLSINLNIALPAQLHDLKIINCSNLETVSVKESLQALTCLRNLQLEHCCRRMSKSFVESAVSQHFTTLEDCTITFGDLRLDMKNIRMRSDTNVFKQNIYKDLKSENEVQKADNKTEQIWSSTELLSVVLSNIPSPFVEELSVRGFDCRKPRINGFTITCNSLDSLPANICRFSSLNRLLIDTFEDPSLQGEGWPYDELGETFLGLESVRHVMISDCETLRSLPCFLLLQSLQIEGCHGIRDLESLRCAMPFLQDLVISDCKNLEDSPSKGFTALLSLRRLIIRHCPKLSNLSAKEHCALPSSLSVIIIKSCEKLQIEHIEEHMSDLTSMERLVIWNCGGSISKLLVKLLLNLFKQEYGFRCRVISKEFTFQWIYEEYDSWNQLDDSKRSTIYWKVKSYAEGNVDSWNCLEFLVEMLVMMSTYNIDELTIGGFHELEEIEGSFQKVLSLTGLSKLTIANCSNLSVPPIAEIQSRLPSLRSLCIESCGSLYELNADRLMIKECELEDEIKWEMETLEEWKIWEKVSEKRDNTDIS